MHFAIYKHFQVNKRIKSACYRAFIGAGSLRNGIRGGFVII
uniref:Uncharacterized protein n=1 Tax=Anguilla anguilla TaxID=7936 RepID=A0A0E9R9V2_ANGAN